MVRFTSRVKRQDFTWCQVLFSPWMEHLSITKTLKRMFCGVPTSNLSRNMDIDHRGVLTWIYDANPSSPVHGGNRSVFCRSQIMRLCYLTPFLFIFLHKTPYFTEILDLNFELEMKLYFYCWWVLRDCAIRETRVPHGMASLRQANVGNDMKKYSSPLIFTFYHDRDTSVLYLFPVIVFQ